MPRFLLLAFVAGFLAVPCFHQPVVGLLHAYGVIPAAPYAIASVPPLGVPAWVSASFWGGLWGIALLGLLRWREITRGLWWKASLFGGIALTLVAMLIVFPLKGRGIDPAIFPIGFMVNGAWGLGTLIFARAFAGTRSPSPL